MPLLRLRFLLPGECKNSDLDRPIKQAACEGALRGAVLAVDSIGVFKLHVLHGCLLDSLAHLLTRLLFSHIWQAALTRRTAKLARASGSLARSVATVAYCCAQAVRAATSSLAMPPATHIRQAPCFCMSPASQDRQTHRFVMFPASCIWPNTAFCNVVCKP